MKRTLMATTVACVLGVAGFNALAATSTSTSHPSIAPIVPSGVLVINSEITQNTCQLPGGAGDTDTTMAGASVDQVSEGLTAREPIHVPLTGCTGNQAQPGLAFNAVTSQLDPNNPLALKDQNATNADLLLFTNSDGTGQIDPRSGDTLSAPASNVVTFYGQLVKASGAVQAGPFVAKSNVYVNYP